MRFRWFTVVAASTALVAVGAQAASAKVPPQQMTRFHALEVAFFGPQAKWSNALEALGAKATVAQAFIPALKAFDTGLLKVGFTGKTAADAAAIVGNNKQLIVLMSSIHSLKAFETGFSALDTKDLPLVGAFAKDLGIPEGDLYT